MLGLSKPRATLSFLSVVLLQSCIVWPSSLLHFYVSSLSSCSISPSTGFCAVSWSFKWLIEKKWMSIILVKWTFSVRYLQAAGRILRRQPEVGTVRTAKITTLLTRLQGEYYNFTHATVLKCIKKLDKGYIYIHIYFPPYINSAMLRTPDEVFFGHWVSIVLPA